ncbi:Crp/Fnr family transcriptional regulator [Nitrosomonas sp. ANs5]|uniref:Crp/Fnr family transcriptional regulator n=1 Tax=Nitrosomonas sp. ANs5 TaxID=3423941 RepID=UPI003D3597F3
MPDDTLARQSPYLEMIKLSSGKMLYKANEELEHLYFPVDSIIALLRQMEDGNYTEAAVVGSDGIPGVSMLMSGHCSFSAMTQSAGRAFRIKVTPPNTEFDLNGAMMHLLLRYTQALITQIAQTAVCIGHPPLAQQLCRWLLLSLDCQPGNELVITQQVIADILGVRREGITAAASNLRHLNLITYQRGHITVLNRSGIETRACECYAAVKRETNHLLPNRLAT